MHSYLYNMYYILYLNICYKFLRRQRHLLGSFLFVFASLGRGGFAEETREKRSVDFKLSSKTSICAIASKSPKSHQIDPLRFVLTHDFVHRPLTHRLSCSSRVRCCLRQALVGSTKMHEALEFSPSQGAFSGYICMVKKNLVVSYPWLSHYIPLYPDTKNPDWICTLQLPSDPQGQPFSGSPSSSSVNSVQPNTTSSYRLLMKHGLMW